MNSKGQMKMGLGAILLIGGIVLVVVLLMNSQGGTGGQGGNIVFPVDVALTYSGYDKAEPGTTFAPTTTLVSVNGVAFDDTITAVSGGDTIEIVAEEAGYHNAYVSTLTLPTDKTTKIVQIPFNADATATITIYNEDGDVLDQTAAVGASYILPVKFKGEDGTSTQDMRCILEITDSTLMTEMKLNSVPGVSYKGKDKPSWYAVVGADSGVWVYDISAIEGAVTVKDGNLVITGKSGETLAAESAYITCYTKDHFVDTFTGKHMFDVEDSQGNLQSLNDYTQTIAFV